MSIDSTVRRSAVLLALVLTALAAASAQIHSYAQTPTSLSLEQALTLAEIRSRSVKAYDLGARAAREQAVAASQLPDPVVRFGLNNLPVTGSDQFSFARDFMTMRSIGVMQELTRDDKRRARSERFEKEAEVAQSAQAVALANLRRDTAMAWLERHFQERLRTLLSHQIDEANLQVIAAESAYRGGRGSQADLFAARLAVAQIEDRMRQTERRVQTAQTRLMRWIGEDAGLALSTPPSMLQTGLEIASLAQQLARHPFIELLARQEAVARAEADIASHNRRADWSLELMYSQRGPAYSNMVSINATIPLQWDPKNRQDRELAAKLALADQIQAQREEASREYLAEVGAWLQQWRSNRDRLAHYERSLIQLAGERTQAALATYRGGMTTLTTVLESRRAEIDVRADQIRLEMETAELWARLNFLIPGTSGVGLAVVTTPSLER